MPRLHSSYLVRCWESSSGLQRIEILHIQSGEKALVTTFDAAIEWLKTNQADDAGHTGGELTGTEGAAE